MEKNPILKEGEYSPPPLITTLVVPTSILKVKTTSCLDKVTSSSLLSVLFKDKLLVRRFRLKIVNHQKIETSSLEI